MLNRQPELKSKGQPADRLHIQPTTQQLLTLFIVRELLNNYSFKVCRDTGEVFVYDNGLYVPNGEAYIAEGVEDAMKGIKNAAVTNQLIREVLGHIRRTSSVVVNRKKFNSQSHLLNLENGILNVNTMEVIPHSKDFLSTVRLPIQYDSNAICPRIAKFFSEIVAPEFVPLLEELFGWCLDFHSPIQKLVILLGETHAGKSISLKLLGTFLGEDNCSHIPLQNLSDRFNKVELYGKFANLYADISSTDLKETATLKTLTAHDPIFGEDKGIKGFRFVPWAKLIFSANTPPRLSEDSSAIWERLVIIPFLNQFIGDKDDKELLSKLTTPGELSGLLNIALSALKRLKERRDTFTYLPSRDEVRDEYLFKVGLVEAFLEETCYISPEKWISKEDLFRGFIEFCKEKGVPAFKKTKLGRELSSISRKERQFRARGTGWEGLTLKELISEEELKQQGKEAVVRLNLN